MDECLDDVDDPVIFENMKTSSTGCRESCSGDLNYAGWSKNQTATWQILWENSTIYWTLFEH